MQKRRVKIREHSLLARIAARKLRFGHVAIVFGHTIHLYNITIDGFFARPSWVLHELKHVEQYERLGFFPFLWRYFREYLKYGYYNAPLEVEARAAESEVSLLEQYDLSAYNSQ